MKKLKKLICIGIAMLLCSCAGEYAKTSAGDVYASARVGTDTYRRTVRNGNFRSDIWGENNSNAVDKVASWGKFKIGAGVANDLGSEVVNEAAKIID